jgi:exopolyphosphatase/guanosine-5'-triphosphate,3'-diphosphate pyrophosphatase
MAAVKLALTKYDPDAVTGLRLSPLAVDELYAQLAAATVAERRVLPGMEPQRADVIAGGVAIYARIVARVQAPVMIACDRGIRWGIAYERHET